MNKLINVLQATDLTEGPPVLRELVLLRIRTPQETRTAVLKEAEIFGARVVDSAVEGFALEATGDPEKLDEFIDVMRSYGEIEVTRSGVVAVSLGSQETAPASRRFPPWAKATQCPCKTITSGVIEWQNVITKKTAISSYLEGPDGRHHRLRQPGPRARAESARFRRRRRRRPVPPAARAGPRPKPPACKVMTTADAAKAADVDHDPGARSHPGRPLQQRDRAAPDRRQDADVRARLQHPLRRHHAARRTSTSP